MLEETVQHCALGCCLYIHGESISWSEYLKHAETGQALIPCLKDVLGKRMAGELGFYLGSIQRLEPARPLVFDNKTHRFLREARQEDLDKWKSLNRKIVEENKAG